jgi:cephalosporin hydroxylase
MFSNLLDRFHVMNAKRELKKFAPMLANDSKGLNSKELVALLYNKQWERFFWTKQVLSEFEQLARVVEQKKPKVVVEIGTNTGGTLFVFTKLADTQATVVSIDLPGGKGGGGYPEYKTNFFKSFACAGQQMHFIKSNSHLPETVAQLKTILNNREIDFLFIDGDHSYEGVKRDFELYSPFVSPHGIIAFHDTKIYPDEHWIKVGRFWNEIKNKYIFQEFSDGGFDWGGIGMIIKDK